MVHYFSSIHAGPCIISFHFVGRPVVGHSDACVICIINRHSDIASVQWQYWKQCVSCFRSGHFQWLVPWFNMNWNAPKKMSNIIHCKFSQTHVTYGWALFHPNFLIQLKSCILSNFLPWWQSRWRYPHYCFIYWLISQSILNQFLWNFIHS